MPWIQLTVDASGPVAEDLGEQLQALGAVSVSYLDVGEKPILEPLPGAEPAVQTWNDARVVALFALDADVQALRAACSGLSLDVDFLADQDWSATWRQFSEVRTFGRLTVAPCDADVVASPMLRLDPGLAFGPGSHPTTRLCLEWLAEQDLDDRALLDYGCGSGILAIAAMLLGAKRVTAVDHDPQALAATRENATRNRIRMHVEPSQGFSPVEPFDIVIANILAGTLVDLAPRLGECLADDGRLILSGILSDQIERVVAAYPTFTFQPPRQMQDWVLLRAERA